MYAPPRMRLSSWCRALSCGAALSIAACGTPAAPSDAGTDAPLASCAAPGAPTAGASDTHCGAGDFVVAQEASCHVTGLDGGIPPCEYGETRFGLEADDDECKYHFAWSSTPICEGPGGVRFTVVATNSDGTPLIAARMRAETFVTDGAPGCDDTTRHPGPNSFMPLREGPPGTYVGVLVFDTPGQWTVRFHVRDECADVPSDTPHGHAAFRLTVP